MSNFSKLALILEEDKALASSTGQQPTQQQQPDGQPTIDGELIAF
jgi:hypothetical protein